MIKLRKKEGFTLIELMIVVAIIGVLAAIAIPAFMNYIKRSKTTEATNNLKALYTGAASYYTNVNSQPGLNPTGAQEFCTVAGQTTPNAPSQNKTRLNVTSAAATASFYALGFQPGEPVYYQYAVVAGTADGDCGHQGSEEIYTMRAIGDLDGDGALSRFDLAVGTDSENNMIRAPGVYKVDELE